MSTILSTLFALFFFMVKLLPAYIGIQNEQMMALSDVFVRDIFSKHGGENDTLSKSEFESYVNHIHNFSLPYNHSSGILVFDCLDHPDFYASHSELCSNASDKCYTAAQLIELVQDFPFHNTIYTDANSTDENSTFATETSFAISNNSITVKSFQIICPILLHQLETGKCSMEATQSDAVTSSKPSPLEVWGYGFLFVTVINLSAVFGAVLLPLMQKKFFNRLLIMLVGLAVGSLSGSAAFHLIPQAYGLLNKEKGNHSYLYISLLILCGIYFFFMVERFLKIFIAYKKRNRQEKLKPNLSVEVLRCTPGIVDDALQELTVSTIDMSKANMTHCSLEHSIVQKQESKHEHHIEFKPGQDSAIATVAWMIVFGDGLHNFIDGLSIGAAFNESIMTGVSISVAVICEELPHELGDLAVLLNSGMSIKQALLYNLLSACTCYLGLIVGTLLGELAEASMYIFAFAGGVFLYISLVDMIPEMNEEVENASKDGVCDAIKVIALQNVGWITGTAVLFTLAFFTEDIQFA